MCDLQIITYLAENPSFSTLPCFFLNFFPGFLVLCFILSIMNTPLLSKSNIMLGLGKCNSSINIIIRILTFAECQLYAIFGSSLLFHIILQCYPFVDYPKRYAIYPRPHSQDLNHLFSFSKTSLVYYFRAHKIFVGTISFKLPNFLMW